MTTLKTALATYGHTRAIKDGSVTPTRATLEFDGPDFDRLIADIEADG